ncbi:hypothetical protein O181_066235 [Austropuccinia psidii MF-1]|uniref:Uncharacterized protein n=1 Tax=Austropuccinia psidii MF-1 TaxID=1389203 RepID=A0A9Q3EWP4_9BASI|nr:hypothetical protein [Austropuccinia psidii MF-1]
MYASRANPTATHSRPVWHPMVRGLILRPSSEPPEDVPTREPEPEVAPTQSTEEPFGNSPLLFLSSYQLFLTPPLTISSSSHYSTLRNHHQTYAHCIPPPHSPSPHVTPPATPTPVPSPVPPRTPPPPPPWCQAPFIPTMMLARNLPTYDRL